MSKETLMARDGLSERQNLLFDYLLQRSSNGECALPVDELAVHLQVSDEGDLEWLRTDLKEIRAASFWKSTESGEELMTWITKAAIDPEKHTVWVQLGGAALYTPD